LSRIIFTKNRDYDNLFVIMTVKQIDELAVGKRLAKIRRARGLSQQEVANVLAVCRGTVAEYERGRINISAEAILKLAIYYQISSDELLGLKSSGTTTEEESLKIMKRLRMIKELPLVKQNAILLRIDKYLVKQGIDYTQ